MQIRYCIPWYSYICVWLLFLIKYILVKCYLFIKLVSSWKLSLVARRIMENKKVAFWTMDGLFIEKIHHMDHAIYEHWLGTKTKTKNEKVIIKDLYHENECWQLVVIWIQKANETYTLSLMMLSDGYMVGTECLSINPFTHEWVDLSCL